MDTPRSHLFDTARMFGDEDDERESGRSLLETAFTRPDEELLQLSQRTETPIAPPSEDPISVPNDDFDGVHALPRLPIDAPEWMLQARQLSVRLERAIAKGRASHTAQLRIQRAALAYSALENSNARIVRVAHMVRRAHRAIRETQRPVLEPAIRDCAEILYGGLSTRLRQVTPFEAVLEIVRQLYAEADPWVAVVNATASLLGWSDAARLHAAEAIRTAIEEHQRQEG
ncbi:MAG: hypothetical protein H6718_33255 [Polyangiaceae bacterium]|nr:hypothetical protein [Polyangiaceae bacterium]MCB9605019.1 hypothetical protein [Polyangiaceae bacterium]